MKAEKAMVADDGKPGKSLKETSTEELKSTLAKLKPTDPGAEARIEAIKGELKARGDSDMEKAKQPSASTSLTPEKARQMLHERSGGHGRPITEQQRKFFGAVGGHLPAPGEKAKKSMAYNDLDDFLEKAKYISRKRVGDRWVYKYADDKKKKPAAESGGKAIDAQQAQMLVNQAQAKVGGTGTSVSFPDDAGAAKKMLDGMPDGTVVARHDRSGAAQTTMAKLKGQWVTAQADTASDDWGDDDYDVKHVFNAAEMSKIVSRGQNWKEGVVWTPESATVQKSLGTEMVLEDWMEKAKYTSRKRVGNRWVYTYADDKKKKESVPDWKGSHTIDVEHEVKTILHSGSGNPERFKSAAERMAARAKDSGYQKEYSRQMQRAAVAQAIMDVGRPTGTVAEARPQEERLMKIAAARASKAALEAEPSAEPKKSAPKTAAQKGKGAVAKQAKKLQAKPRGAKVSFGDFGAEKMRSGNWQVWQEGQEGRSQVSGEKLAEMMAVESTKKSMDGIEGLGDYLEKSGGLPTHQQGMGHKKSGAQGASADGGELADVGRTSGSSDSAPGPEQDAQGQLKGVSPGKKEKLSDDDAEEEKQMTEHKKPIETMKKSRFPADQRESVAQEQAAAVSKLQKSDDVYVGPNVHPYSHQMTHASGDLEASELVKSEGFYHGGSPEVAPSRPIIEQGVLCKSVNGSGCDATYSAALTSCPSCGAGTVGHRHIPGGPVMGAETTILEKSMGPGPLLRRPNQEPDIKIG